MGDSTNLPEDVLSSEADRISSGLANVLLERGKLTQRQLALQAQLEKVAVALPQPLPSTPFLTDCG